ncbi:MAG: HesA/MoeB/ThiF family protein [Planctomycetia bacterium]|nr:HesA/MoeB/ThiF family protein [Planctomycetia bacterium]
MDRFDRQLRVTDWGETAQSHFARATVLLCGCGALGSMIATLLVRAGIGRLRIVDHDVVGTPDLHRQILFFQSDADRRERKVDVAARELRRIGTDTRIEPICETIDETSIDELCDGVGLIVDALDHWPTRFLLNEASVRWNLPWIHGAVLRTSGQIAVFRPGKTMCLRCLLTPDDTPSPGVSVAGVLSPIVTTIASLEAIETMKLAGKVDESLILNDLWCVDLWRSSWRRLTLTTPDPMCPICSGRTHIRECFSPE